MMAAIYTFTPYESRAESPPAPTELHQTETEMPLTFTKEEHTDWGFVCSF